MRRLALSLIASCSIAVFSACSGGGNGLPYGGTTPDSVTFTTSSGQVNNFSLAPGGSITTPVNALAPLQINVTGFKGSGAEAVVVPNALFHFAANILPGGETYTKGPAPSTTATCPAYNGATPAVPLLEHDLNGGLYGLTKPYFSGYTLIPSTLSYNGTSVWVAPPLDPQTGIALAGPFCIQVDAFYGTSTTAVGATYVIYSNSP